MNWHIFRKVFTDEKRFAMLLLFIVVCCGVYWRIDGVMDRGFEYDELWTAQYFVHSTPFAILTHFSTPNNHPLSTLLIKYSMSFWGDNALGLRFPSLLFGIMLIPLVWTLAYLLFRSFPAALAAAIFCAFNGNLIHYSNTARGYIIQSFLLSLTLLLVVLIERRNRGSTCENWLFLSIFISSILSIMTLSTSIIFLFPLLFCHSLQRLAPLLKSRDWWAFVSKNKAWLLSYSSITIFVLVWCLSNLRQLRAGQAFGNNPGGMLELCEYFASIGGQLVNVVVLLCLLPLFFYYRKLALSLLFYVFFIVLCGRLFECGPARVYTFSSVVLILGAAGGAAVVIERFSRSWRLISIAVLFTVSAYLAGSETKKWEPFDWKSVTPKIIAAFGKEYYLNYPPGAGYEILSNNGMEAVCDSISRIPEKNAFWVEVNAGETISAISLSDPSKILVFPFAGKLSPRRAIVDFSTCYIYRMEKFDATNQGSNLTVITIPMVEKSIVGNFESFLNSTGKNWAKSNNWFNCVDISKDKQHTFAVYVSDNAAFTAGQIKQISDLSGGKIHFFALAGIPEKYDLPNLNAPSNTPSNFRHPSH